MERPSAVNVSDSKTNAVRIFPGKGRLLENNAGRTRSAHSRLRLETFQFRCEPYSLLDIVGCSGETTGGTKLAGLVEVGITG